MAKGRKHKHHKRDQQIAAYLAAHPQVALTALRTDPVLAADSIRSMLTMDAAKGAPLRESAPYPVLGPFGGISTTQPLQQTLPKQTPVNIRRFTEIPPARRAMCAVMDPIMDLPWTIELRKPIGNKAHQTQQEPNAEEQRRIEDVTTMLIAPNNDMSWRNFVRIVLEDLITFGAGVIELQENASDERPFFMWPIDAQSVRVNAGWQEGSEAFRYSQGRGYYYGSIGTPDLIKFRDDEVCYMKLNPRDSTPFGLGYAEVAFGAINAFIGGFEYAERRASNNTPNFGIFLGENVTIEQARQWNHYWVNEIEGNGKVPIIGGGKQPEVFAMMGTGEDNLMIRWQEFCIRVIAMSFGVSPFRLGMERDVNRSTADASQDNDWMTVAPVANVIRDYLTYWLLWKRMGYKDLEFVWQIKTADELKQAEILAEQYTMNAITVDEIRLHYERAPLDDGMGDLTKTAYEESIKASLQPETLPGSSAAPGKEGGDTDAPAGYPAARKYPRGTPFDDEEVANTISPAEREFLKALKRAKRHERYGIAAVAT